MIGKKLINLRKSVGESQKDLGKVLGVTTSMVGMYETDVRNPSYDVLLKIANHFGVSTDYLLGREKEVNSQTNLTSERYSRI